jgi:hypothetical protein
MTLDSVPYATVYIDGQRIGDTPIIGHELSPGLHQVRAVAANGTEQSFTVQIKPGQHLRRRLRL